MKTALITGASRGIGAAAARTLARDGWRVIINYNRSKDAAEALAAELGGIAVQADVSDFAQVQAMFDQTGPVDLLVNNSIYILHRNHLRAYYRLILFFSQLLF